MSQATAGFNTNRPALSRRAFLTATGSTLAGTALVAAPLAMAKAAEPHPDAKLIALGKEYERASAKANSQLASEEELEAAFVELTAIEFAIQDCQASTLEGLAVKAHVVRNGEYCVFGREEKLLDDIIPSLISDLLRMTEA